LENTDVAQILAEVAELVEFTGRDLDNKPQPQVGISCSNRSQFTVVPGMTFEILATNVDPVVLDRARKECYPLGALLELPEASWQIFSR
jgi:hypothetical protein